jgi:hypothetical protein
MPPIWGRDVIVIDTNAGCRHAVGSGLEHIAQEFDGIINSLRQIGDVSINR